MVYQVLADIIRIERERKLLQRREADVIEPLLVLLERKFAIMDVALASEPEDPTQVAHFLRHDLPQNDQLSDWIHIQDLVIELDAHFPLRFYLCIVDCFDEFAHSLLLTLSQHEVVRDDAPAFLPRLVGFKIYSVLEREVLAPRLLDKALVWFDYSEGLA